MDAYVLPRTSLALLGAAAGIAVAVWLRPGESPGLGPLRLPSVAVLVAAAAAAAMSINPMRSLAGGYSRYEDLVVRAAYVGLFCASVWLLRTGQAQRRTLTAFLAGCCLVALQALWQAVPGNFSGRPDGNLGQPNLLGGLMAMALPLAVWRARVLHPGWSAAALLIAGALFFSTSRSGWLAAAAGLLALYPLAASRHAAFKAAFGMAAVAAVLLLLLATPLRELNQDTGSARLHLWQDTVRLVAARPLTGWGEDTLALVYGRYLTGDWEPQHTFDRAHSQVLDLAAAQGLAGIAASAWFWGVFAVVTWRRRRAEEVVPIAAAVAAYAVWSLLNFAWAPVTAPLWILAGVAWAAAQAGQVERATFMRRRAVAVPASLLLISAGMYLAAAPLVADIAYQRGQPRLAATAFPLQAEYHRVLGERTSSIPELRRAAELGESDSAVFVLLGDLELGNGQRAAADADYRRAAELNPFDQAARARLAALAEAEH